jgi:hypothetical protein
MYTYVLYHSVLPILHKIFLCNLLVNKGVKKTYFTCKYNRKVVMIGLDLRQFARVSGFEYSRIRDMARDGNVWDGNEWDGNEWEGNVYGILINKNIEYICFNFTPAYDDI